MIVGFFVLKTFTIERYSMLYYRKSGGIYNDTPRYKGNIYR